MRKLTKDEVVQVNGGTTLAMPVQTAPDIAKTVCIIGAVIAAVWVMPIALLLAGFASDAPTLNDEMVFSIFLGIEMVGALIGSAVGYALGTLADFMVD